MLLVSPVVDTASSTPSLDGSHEGRTNPETPIPEHLVRNREKQGGLPVAESGSRGHTSVDVSGAGLK